MKLPKNKVHHASAEITWFLLEKKNLIACVLLNQALFQGRCGIYLEMIRGSRDLGHFFMQKELVLEES